MLHSSLINKDAHPEAGQIAPRVAANNRNARKAMAGYAQSWNLGWIHLHSEMNYRKKELGYAAYTYKHTDYYAPWQTTSPCRHIQKPLPGSWFGAGHWNCYLNHNVAWKLWTRSFICLGSLYPIYAHWRRMTRNGWQVKNKAAVYGID